MVAPGTRAVIGLCLLAAASAFWAISAISLLDGAKNYVSDGLCFEGEPWRYVQAAVAVPGICLAATSVAFGLRKLLGRDASRRLIIGVLVAAGVCFAAWLAVVIFAVAPYSFAKDQQSLPEIYCTYENDPFD